MYQSNILPMLEPPHLCQHHASESILHSVLWRVLNFGSLSCYLVLRHPICKADEAGGRLMHATVKGRIALFYLLDTMSQNFWYITIMKMDGSGLKVQYSWHGFCATVKHLGSFVVETKHWRWQRSLKHAYMHIPHSPLQGWMYLARWLHVWSTQREVKLMTKARQYFSFFLLSSCTVKIKVIASMDSSSCETIFWSL